MQEEHPTWLHKDHYPLWEEIPQRMRGGIDRYVNLGVLPGRFLQSVITNDLTSAANSADNENSRLLELYAKFFSSALPVGSTGDAKIMRAWRDKGGLEENT